MISPGTDVGERLDKPKQLEDLMFPYQETARWRQSSLTRCWERARCIQSRSWLARTGPMDFRKPWRWWNMRPVDISEIRNIAEYEDERRDWRPVVMELKGR